MMYYLKLLLCIVMAGIGLWGYCTPLAALFLGMALLTVIRKENGENKA